MLEILIIAAVVALDQASKYLTDLFLTPLGSSIPLWPGVFHLTSAHNEGAAWGMMQGGRIFFIVLTVCVAAFLVWHLAKNRKSMRMLARVTLALIIGGAIGNLIDRVLYGYVRDMFYFILIDFPVFNVADSALSVGCALLMFDVLVKKDATVWGPEPEKPSEPPTASHDAKAQDKQDG